jgi:peptidoglycan/LPS O-acetylase OafA/YrhL
LNDRVASLDLLRGVAACSVAIPHFFVYRGSGGAIPENISVIAVEIFFVLSGFVLAPQILLILEGKVKRGLPTFLVRRWMRTIPAFFVALIFASAVFGKLGSADFWRYAAYVQNLFRQHNDADYFPIAWSLSVEEWFYVAFPLFMLLGSRLWPSQGDARRHYAALAFLFIALITIGRTLFGDEGSWGSAVRRVTAFRVDSIAYGFLLYLGQAWLSARLTPWMQGGGLAICVAVLFALLGSVEHSAVAQRLYPLVAAAFGALVILIFLAGDALLQGPLARRLADFSGKISYAIYLFHLICIYAVTVALGASTLALQFAVYCVSVLILAAISTFLFEQPILQLRPRYRQVEPVPLPEYKRA